MSLQHKEVSLTTHKKDIGSDNSYTFFINPPIKHIKKFRFSECEFAWSHHVINDINNKINFKEGGGGTLVATIVNGNYTRTGMAAAVKVALEAAGALTYTVTISKNTYFITIAPTTSTVQILASGTNSCHKTIGFQVDSADSASVTSDSVVVLSGLNHVNLHSNVALIRDHGSFYNNGKTSHDVLQRIPVPVNSGGIILYNATDQPFSDAHGEISEVSIRLGDPDNNTINLNGADISFKLEFFTEHKDINF